jgi:hypothetical protein
MFFSIIFFFACEAEEHFPDVNASRDADLFGTWKSIHSSPNDSSLYVFTNKGYVGSTSYVNNAQIKGFTNIHEIWHNIEGVADDGWGKIYIADGSSSWTKMRNVGEKFYRLSESKDTLYLASVSLKTKQADKENATVFVKNSYQLIFDGPRYIGIETIE